jgi:hypothetical protein
MSICRVSFLLSGLEDVLSGCNHGFRLTNPPAKGKLLNLQSQIKTGYMGPGVFPLPVFAVSSSDQLASFRIRPDSASKASLRLNDFFDLDKPGRYELTVWPVIYKARNTNGTNADLCERMIIPPVTATFHWSGKPPE